MVEIAGVTIGICDVCGYRWIINRRPPFRVENEDDLPKYCASQKCHSKNWNTKHKEEESN